MLVQTAHSRCRKVFKGEDAFFLLTPCCAHRVKGSSFAVNERQSLIRTCYIDRRLHATCHRRFQVLLALVFGLDRSLSGIHVCFFSSHGGKSNESSLYSGHGQIQSNSRREPVVETVVMQDSFNGHLQMTVIS